jgi:hypothetical protein
MKENHHFQAKNFRKVVERKSKCAQKERETANGGELPRIETEFV